VTEHSSTQEAFREFSRSVSNAVGSTWAAASALAVVVAWAAFGPIAQFSSTWQLVINTGTTIVTFLMVFVIQNSQNRDSLALHLKLDELLRAVEQARDEVVDLEDAPDHEMKSLREEFASIRARAQNGNLPGSAPQTHSVRGKPR